MKIESELFGGHSIFHFLPSSLKQSHTKLKGDSSSDIEYTLIQLKGK